MKEKQNTTQETEITFDQVKHQILATGKQRGVLSYEEIAEKLSVFDIDSDVMDEFYEYIREQGVELIGSMEEEAAMPSVED